MAKRTCSYCKKAFDPVTSHQVNCTRLCTTRKADARRNERRARGQTASKEPTSDHVVLGTNTVICTHCGIKQEIAFPCSISVMLAIFKAFTKDHRRCEKTAAGEKASSPKALGDWLASADTGISSRVIYAVFTGHPVTGRWTSTPHDPADFGRCYRLLEIAPAHWRENLSKVSDRYPHWGPLVEQWDECERLYREELPQGKAPKLYALMKTLAATEPA